MPWGLPKFLNVFFSRRKSVTLSSSCGQQPPCPTLGSYPNLHKMHAKARQDFLENSSHLWQHLGGPQPTRGSCSPCTLNPVHPLQPVSCRHVLHSILFKTLAAFRNAHRTFPSMRCICSTPNSFTPLAAQPRALFQQSSLGSKITVHLQYQSDFLFFFPPQDRVVLHSQKVLNSYWKQSFW